MTGFTRSAAVSSDVFVQNSLQCRHRAAVRSGNLCACSGITENTSDHFMGYGAGKKYDQIRRSYVFQPTRHLRIYLRFALILTTQFLILSGHTLIAAYNYNTHSFSPSG